MLGRIAAVVCWVAGVYVLFNIPQLYRSDFSSFSAYYSAKESIGMTFYRWRVCAFWCHAVGAGNLCHAADQDSGERRAEGRAYRKVACLLSIVGA